MISKSLFTRTVVYQSSVFTARRYASAVYAVVVVSVRPSVCHKSEFYEDG